MNSLEGKKGLVGEDVFLLEENGLLMACGLSIPHCLQPEVFLNTDWERGKEFIFPSVKEGNSGIEQQIVQETIPSAGCLLPCLY